MPEKRRTVPDTPIVPSIPTDPGRAVPFNRALTEPATTARPLDATGRTFFELDPGGPDEPGGPDPVAAALAAAAASLEVEARLAGAPIDDATALDRAFALYREAQRRLAAAGVDAAPRTASGAPPRAAPGLDPDHPEALTGRSLAGYHLHKVIGRGGMGCVYAARRLSDGQEVALKLLHSGGTAHGERMWLRFRQEATAMVRIGHPGFPRLEDVIDADGIRGIAIELLHGVTLRQTLASCSGLRVRNAVEIAVRAGEALAAAHAVGVLHTDLKPDNIMLAAPTGRPGEVVGSDGLSVKVLDLGMAILDQMDADAGCAITREGVCIGTPYYMACEQVRGERLDERTDLYQLALVLYECLAGDNPFRSAKNPYEVLSRKVSAEPLPSLQKSNPAVPRALDALIASALHVERARRPRSVADFMRALDAIPLGGSSEELWTPLT